MNPHSRPDPTQNATHQAWGSAASEYPDMAREIDGEPDPREATLASQEAMSRILFALTDGGKEALKIVLGIAGMLAASPNPLLTVKALPFAAGLPMTEGRSEAEVAKEAGISRAHFNKEVRRLQHVLRIDQTRNNKTAEARKHYQEIAHHDHWRKQDAKQAARVAIRRASKGQPDRKRAGL